ncbi:Uncharacterised protein [Streptococcus pneumoniae]|nr:Uncharacterised protein [Streptococcus pneumoniae]
MNDLGILMISLYMLKKGMFYAIPNNFSILLIKSLYFELSFSLLTSLILLLYHPYLSLFSFTRMSKCTRIS